MSEWISVKDRLPDDFRFVLICVGECITLMGRYNHGKKEWRVFAERTAPEIAVTHWMERPEPPK